MRRMTIHIEGMSCEHCIMSVRRMLQQMPTIEVVDVRVGEATIQMPDDENPLPIIAERLEDLGYQLIPIAPPA